MKRFKVTNNVLELYRPFPKLWRKKAFELSIEKWEAIVNHLEESNSKSIDSQGFETCALCELYFEFCCSGCPISENTGMEGCEGTPQEHEPTLGQAKLELLYLKQLYGKLYPPK